MSDSTRKLALSALNVAMAVVLLCFAAVFPTGRIALAAIAGLCTAVVLIECGIGYSVLGFIAVSTISFFITPDKAATTSYIIFLGYYPIVKGMIERKNFQMAEEWILKLLSFNLAMTVLLLIYRYVYLSVGFESRFALPIIVIGGNVIFVIYDIVFTKLISLYIKRVSSRIQKK